ncbi:MAG TPA: helix-turn-helix domain-containing protein [Acidobacteriaceae bacterium]|nr:helix-turn-helix domain-containing protein [Acidobacteriaceae bacterium]
MGREGGVAAFGEQLRRAREARGLALESICETTKVPARHIRALESGSYDELPGGVFRRGFVRSYLAVVGLEEGDWMKRFEESCRTSGVRDAAGREWAAFAENVKNNRPASYRRAGVRGALAISVLAVIALAGWCGWRLKSHRPLLPVRLVWARTNSWVDKAASR